jgi:hypothetical protein
MAGGRILPPSMERLWLGELRRAHAIINIISIPFRGAAQALASRAPARGRQPLCHLCARLVSPFDVHATLAHLLALRVSTRQATSFCQSTSAGSPRSEAGGRIDSARGGLTEAGETELEGG